MFCGHRSILIIMKIIFQNEEIEYKNFKIGLTFVFANPPYMWQTRFEKQAIYNMRNTIIIK